MRIVRLSATTSTVQTPLFSDVHVRQAIAKAVDRDALVQVASGAAPVHTFITPGMIAYSTEMETYGQELQPHDVAAAQVLLAGQIAMVMTL